MASNSLSPNSTGEPGPGDFAGGTVDFSLTGVNGENFDTFGCAVRGGIFATADWQTANVYFERKVFTDGLMRMPDGQDVVYWGFEDRINGEDKKPFPSALIRVQEGDLVHVKMEPRRGTHTIHHHGIEPTTMNDGVGHVSFEVNESYVYQFQPRQAGTWFYHCHKNTVLHFEMGLVGGLIVDPVPNPNGKVPAYAGGPEYDVEMFWIFDDMDPRWHKLGDEEQNAGMCGEDVGLHKFEPKYFLVSGVPTQPNIISQPAAIKANRGQKILIRTLNASYSLLRTTFSGLEAQIIAVDGHPLNKPWNRWVTIKPEPSSPTKSAFVMATASRYDILIDLSSPANANKVGTFLVDFQWQHWITRKIHNQRNRKYAGTAKTTITIT